MVLAAKSIEDLAGTNCAGERWVLFTKQPAEPYIHRLWFGRGNHGSEHFLAGESLAIIPRLR
jgi:hypothetical protein